MSNKGLNITIDLETLGNTVRAPIIQIGAVKFKNDGEVLDTFTRNIKLQSLEKYDFKLDYSTIKWWMEQDKAAQQMVFTDDGIDIRLALREFIEWVGKTSDYVYWTHATFDAPILGNHFRELGIENPIPFRLHRDIRTLTQFAGKMEPDYTGVHHNALDDCLRQASYISKMLQKLSWREQNNILEETQ